MCPSKANSSPYPELSINGCLIITFADWALVISAAPLQLIHQVTLNRLIRLLWVDIQDGKHFRQALLVPFAETVKKVQLFDKTELTLLFLNPIESQDTQKILV